MKRFGELLGKIVAGFIAILIVLMVIGFIVGSGDDDGKGGESLGVNALGTPNTPAPTSTSGPTNTPGPMRTPRPPEPTPTPDYDLLLISGTCTTRADIGFITCEGFVQNVRPYPLQNVTAVIVGGDEAGTPTFSGEALIDYNPILAGQQSPWSVIMTYNPAFSGWRVEFKDLLGGSLKTDYAGTQFAQ